MGIICTTSGREKHQDDDCSEEDLYESKQFFDKSPKDTDASSSSMFKVQKEEKFAKIINSASVFWKNSDKMGVFDAHEEEYICKVNGVKGFYRIKGFILTEDVRKSRTKFFNPLKEKNWEVVIINFFFFF